MDKDWKDLVNPFPEATKVAQLFWGKPVSDEWVSELQGHDYGYVLEEHLPHAFKEFQRELRPEVLTYSDSLPESLGRLGKAVRALMEGKLRLKDGAEIALITKLGEGFIVQAVAYFDKGQKETEAGCGPWLAEGNLHPHEYEDLQMVRGRGKILEDFVKEFAKVVHQLDLDLQHQRGGASPSSSG